MEEHFTHWLHKSRKSILVRTTMVVTIARYYCQLSKLECQSLYLATHEIRMYINVSYGRIQYFVLTKDSLGYRRYEIQRYIV